SRGSGSGGADRLTTADPAGLVRTTGGETETGRVPGPDRAVRAGAPLPGSGKLERGPDRAIAGEVTSAATRSPSGRSIGADLIGATTLKRPLASSLSMAEPRNRAWRSSIPVFPP